MTSLSSFSPLELAYVSAIFAKADPLQKGLVTGDEAVKVLAGANLPPATLGVIWNIADDENNGFLTKRGVATVVRLVGWAQKGEVVTPALVDKPGPLPTITGLQLASSAVSPPAISKSPPPSSPFPPLSAEDCAKYSKLFISCGPTNGLLPATKARDVFLKSKLPLEKLTLIWNLADTRARGSLDVVDFIIGMHLIAGSMGAKPLILPSTLPTWLYQQASQASGGKPLDTQTTGGSSYVTSPSSQVPQQFTGPNEFSLSPHLTGQSLRAQAPAAINNRIPPAIPARPTTIYHQPPPVPIVSPFPLAQKATPQSLTWDVTAEEKRASDGFFATLDTQNKGFIEGDVAVPFLLRSNLPEIVLAQVWDLADLSKDGQLTKDTFAVAMHLINTHLAGQELPAVLPPSLIPPSLRSASFAAATVPPPQPVVTEPQRDLWEDSPPSSATHPPSSYQQPQPQPQQIIVEPPPFTVPPAPPKQKHDFLGDDEEQNTRASLPASSAEVGNLQNQLNSTNQALGTTQKERTSVENNLASSASTLSQLQTQLALAKASYETESRLLSDLRERYATQTALIQTTKEDLIRAESDLSALRVEKAEIEGSVLRDKEEVRELQRRMKVAADETEVAKKEIEKAKKDVRLQKGLVVIAKKQLAGVEADKEKTSKELAEVHAELDEVKGELSATEAEIRAAEVLHKEPEPTFGTAPLPPLSPPTSSPLSTVSPKSNNPFDKLMLASASGSSTPVAQSNSPLQNLTTLANTNGTLSSDASGPEAEDPFGLSSDSVTQPTIVNKDLDLSYLSPTTVIAEVPSGGATPRPAQVTLPSNNGERPISMETSLDSPTFFTPPSTATVEGSKWTPNSQNAAELPDIDLSGRFPPLADEPHNPGTDLPPLKEIPESDSSDDDSEDDVPIALLNRNKDEKPALPDDSISRKSITSSNPSFDEMFGLAAPAAQGLNGSSSNHGSPSLGTKILTRSRSTNSMDPSKGATAATPFEPLPTEHAPPPTIETVLEPGPVPSGMSDFDEALARLPENSIPGAFKFDSFAETFDFGSPAFNPPPAAGASLSAFTPHINGNEPSTEGLPSFDEAFGIQPKVSEPATSSLGFDDAFGISAQTNSDGPQLGSTPIPAPIATNPTPIYAPPPGAPPMTPPGNGTNSGPLRSPVSATSSNARSSSPAPRASSPSNGPPSPKIARPSSPKSKSSKNASSPDSHPPRLSKLSLHFPWSKNKDKSSKASKASSSHASNPLPASSSSSTVEEDGDVEAVKQLVGMGFSRDRSVAALEAHAYDLQKALHFLLSSP